MHRSRDHRPYCLGSARKTSEMYIWSVGKPSQQYTVDVGIVTESVSRPEYLSKADNTARNHAKGCMRGYLGELITVDYPQSTSVMDLTK